LLRVFPAPTYAQNLGEHLATGHPVQGQTAAQPAGAVVSLADWPRRFSAIRCETITPIRVFEVREVTGNNRRAPTRPV